MSAEIIPFRIERQDDGELRISDTELAERLEYTDLRVFRRLIKLHEPNLAQLGDVFSKHIAPKTGGRAAKTYLLNEQQAVFIVSRSDMPVATQIMILVSRAFVEMRRQTQRALPIREWMQLAILSEQVSIWEREFPAGFFNHLHRVLGVTKPGRNNHSNCSHFINRYIYSFLFGKLGLEVIREANPADDDYQRAVRHHQVLKDKHKPALRQHIDRVGVMLALSVSLQHFDDQFNHAMSLSNTQIGFLFSEVPGGKA